MRKALSITLMLLVAVSSTAFAKAVDETNALDKLKHVDLSQSSQAPAAGVFGTAQAGTTFFGGTAWDAVDGRWEAIADSCWTFDTGVASSFAASANPDLDPFKDPSLHTIMEGWVGFDNSLGTNSEFRRLDIALTAVPGETWDAQGVGVGDSVFASGGSWSLFCGKLFNESLAACYSDGVGYGNNWFLCSEQTFNHDGLLGSVTWAFDYYSDTEPGFDYTYFVVEPTASDDDLVVQANTGFLGVASASLILNVGTDIRPDSTAGPYTLKYCMASDGAYSDEDGLYPTPIGPLVIDNISVNGGGVGHSANFEANNGNWTLSPFVAGAGGEWSDIKAFTDLSPILTSCDCSFADSVLLFDDLSLGTGHGLFQDNLAASPWIDLVDAGLAGAPGKFIQFEGYFELPLLNYIFVQTNMQWKPTVCPFTGLPITSNFTSDGFVRYFGGVPTCTNPGLNPIRINFGTVVDVGATDLRVALGVISFCRFFGNCTGVSNSTPWFDNVKLGVFGDPNAPIVSASTVDQPIDAFPEDGSLDIASAGRVDTGNVKGFASPEVGSSLGDTLIVEGGSDDGAGGADGARVDVIFAVRPGPGIDTAALNAWLGKHFSRSDIVRTGVTPGSNGWSQWYTARMDTAEQGGALATDTWMTAYHEDATGPGGSLRLGSDTDKDPGDLDPNGNASRLINDIFPDDLFTPGSRLAIMYETSYVGAGAPVGAFQYPIETGGGTSAFTFGEVEGTDGYFEWECLPSSMASDSTWNCVLYVDHFDGRGGQLPTEAGLATTLSAGSDNAENTQWDRWDVEAPSSQQASFGRPAGTEYGASINQALAYQSILWNSGNLTAFNLVDEDAQVLRNWISITFGTADQTNNKFYGSGALAQSITGEGGSEPTALLLLNNDFKVSTTVACYSYGDGGGAGGCDGTPDKTACINTDPVTGALVAGTGAGRSFGHQLQGNGCPQERQFNILTAIAPGGSDPVTLVVQGDENYNSAANTGGTNYASVYTEQQDPSNGPQYQALIDGGAVHYRRSADGANPCLNVADASGNTGNTLAISERLAEALGKFGISASNASGCSDPISIVDVPVGPRQPAFQTRLANFAPNPLVNGAAGEIRFTLARSGAAKVDVFDVNGRLVKTVFEGVGEEGLNVVKWNGTDTAERQVASGVYFYRLHADGETFSKQMVVVRNGN